MYANADYCFDGAPLRKGPCWQTNDENRGEKDESWAIFEETVRSEILFRPIITENETAMAPGIDWMRKDGFEWEKKEALEAKMK